MQWYHRGAFFFSVSDEERSIFNPERDLVKNEIATRLIEESRGCVGTQKKNQIAKTRTPFRRIWVKEGPPVIQKIFSPKNGTTVVRTPIVYSKPQPVMIRYIYRTSIFLVYRKIHLHSTTCVCTVDDNHHSGHPFALHPSKPCAGRRLQKLS